MQIYFLCISISHSGEFHISAQAKRCNALVALNGFQCGRRMRTAGGAPKTLEIHWFFERAARAAARRGPGTGNGYLKNL